MKTKEETKAYQRKKYLENREERIRRAIEYKRRNKDKNKIWSATYREKHATEIAAYNEAYKARDRPKRKKRYEENRVSILAQQKERYEKLKEQDGFREKRAEYRRKNRDAIRIQQREYKREKLWTNPAFRFVENARRRILNALKGIGAKSARTVELLGCTGEEAIAYLERKFTPGMTWENQGQWHVDHIKPLARFDLTDPMQQRVAFHYTNLQPLWARDNRKKWAS